MTSLSGAMRQPKNYKKTELKISYGAHKGYFIGLGEIVEESVQCRRCNGIGNKDGEPCRRCKASGSAVEKKVALRYHFRNERGEDVIQEEWVNYSLSGPGKLANGQPKSATTLHLRMKAMSGGLTSEPDMVAWYESLPKPVKIPIEMMVTDSDKGYGLVIASVRKLQPRTQPAQDPEPLPVDDKTDDLFGE